MLPPEQHDDVCPISLETNVTPRRRSVEVEEPARRSAAAAASPQAAAAVASAAAPPAAQLHHDGSLDLGSMMQPQLGGSQRSLRRLISRSGSSSSAGSREPSVCAGQQQRQLQPQQEDEDALSEEEQQLAAQLAAACEAQAAGALARLLAAGASPSAALDSRGNTALHLVLLPGIEGRLPAAPSLVRAPSGVNGGTGTGSGGSGGGGALCCVAACFSGGGGAAVADGEEFTVHGGGAGGSGGAGAGGSGLRSASSVGRAGSAAAAAAAAQPAMIAALVAAAPLCINTRNRQGQTPLMLAARQPLALAAAGRSGGRVAAALRSLDLLASSPMCDVNAKDPAGRTALALVLQPLPAAAAATGKAGSMHPLSRAASKRAGAGAAAPQAGGASAAVSRTAAAQAKAVALLLSAGGDPNIADRGGCTPLMHAAASPGASAALLELLLEKGGNARLLDGYRRSALTHALLAQRLSLTPALGSSGARMEAGVPAPNGGGGSSTRSSTDASCGNLSSPPGDDLTAAIGASSDGSSGQHQQQQPLEGHGAIIRALLSWGAVDVHPTSINTRIPALCHRTQMHIAVRRGDVGALQLLAASGGDVNARDALGYTPLLYWQVAPPERAQQLVEVLLAHGADPNVANLDGLQPLDLACAFKRAGSSAPAQLTVRIECVPVHAVLVGFGAKNSNAFLHEQQRGGAGTLPCIAASGGAGRLSALSKTFGSFKSVAPGSGSGSARAAPQR